MKNRRRLMIIAGLMMFTLINTTAQISINVLHDTWIGSEAPATNNNADTEMQVMNDGTIERMAVISFDLSSISGHNSDSAVVRQAIFNIFSDQYTSDAEPEFVRADHYYVSIYGLRDKGNNAIDETTLTWNNFPNNELTFFPVAQVDINAEKSYAITTPELTNYVNDALIDKRGTVTFVLKARDEISNTRIWVSSEGVNSSTLDLEATVAHKINVVTHDTWVNQSEPDGNYEGATDMEVTKSVTNSREAFVKFSLDGFKVSEDAFLRIKAAPQTQSPWSPVDSFLIQVLGVKDDSWLESSLSWNNKPEDSVVLAEYNVNYSAWHTINSKELTEYINNAILSSKTEISFKIQGKYNTPTERIWISDKGWSKAVLVNVERQSSINLSAPEIEIIEHDEDNKVWIAMRTETIDAKIHYTTDGSVPGISSDIYTDTFELVLKDEPVIVKAATIKNNEISDISEKAVNLQKPYYGTPFSIPGVIEAWAYDIGGQNVSYYEESPEDVRSCGTSNTIESFRSDSAKIDGCCDESGCTVAWPAKGEWTEYTINIPAGLECFKAYIKYIKAVEGASEVQIDEMDINSKVIQPLVSKTTLAKNAQSWDDGSVERVELDTVFSLTEGEHTIRVTWTESGWNFIDLEIQPATGCQTTSTQISEIQRDIIIFPNPLSNQLNLRLNVNGINETTLYVADITGRLVISKKMALSNGMNQLTIDVSELKEGVYFISSSNISTLKSTKFIILR